MKKDCLDLLHCTFIFGSFWKGATLFVLSVRQKICIEEAHLLQIWYKNAFDIACPTRKLEVMLLEVIFFNFLEFCINLFLTQSLQGIKCKFYTLVYTVWKSRKVSVTEIFFVKSTLCTVWTIQDFSVTDFTWN